MDVQNTSSLWLNEVDAALPVFRLQTSDDVLERIPEIQEQSDYVVVDGPAGLSEVTRAILLVADLALLPCGPSVLDLRAANAAIRVVKQAQAIRHDGPRAFLVPNKLQIQYRLSREMLVTIGNFAVPATPALKLRQAYADAAGQGTMVWRLGTSGEAAAIEIKGLFNGLFGEFTEERERSVDAVGFESRPFGVHQG